ncbi:hypothetical protein TcasGA2_TC009843 [Tribolium castaneum]|uniref:Uncharacterized protein n=1 Tax=Tribolium castaneum TaxID=7070 RepID=D6WPZ2_TRICA|nr:hypothetical protein TcasGA2_TC009843 [Tribolium castaneum]
MQQQQEPVDTEIAPKRRIEFCCRCRHSPLGNVLAKLRRWNVSELLIIWPSASSSWLVPAGRDRLVHRRGGRLSDTARCRQRADTRDRETDSTAGFTWTEVGALGVAVVGVTVQRPLPGVGYLWRRARIHSRIGGHFANVQASISAERTALRVISMLRHCALTTLAHQLQGELSERNDSPHCSRARRRLNQRHVTGR